MIKGERAHNFADRWQEELAHVAELQGGSGMKVELEGMRLGLGGCADMGMVLSLVGTAGGG